MKKSISFSSQIHSNKVDWQSLWQRSQAGDQQAFSKLYQILLPLLYDYGFKIHPRAALVEDALHDVMLTLWQQRNKLHPKSIQQYCFSALRRQLLRNLQKTRFELSVAQLPTTPTEPVPLEAPEASAIAPLQSAINKLTPKQREAIYLRFFAQLDNDEMAQVLGIQKTAVYKLISRALQQLRDLQ